MYKHILFVNAAYAKRTHTFALAKKLGLFVSVVAPDLPEWAYSSVDQYIEANTYNSEETIAIIQQYHRERPFDGVVTFWDRDVELVARIATALGLPGSTPEAAQQSRNKYQMRTKLYEKDVPHPRFAHVSTWEELRAGSEHVEFPLIYKPVAASGSKGVLKVECAEDLRLAYEIMHTFARPESDKMFSFYPNQHLVEEFMDGPEVSVEGLISDRQILIVGITEKLATADTFTEYQHAFPARLPVEMLDQIRSVTRGALMAIGIDHCGFHVELKLTASGPKIVEVNGRLGGDRITTNLVPLATGIDLTSANLQAVVGEQFDLTPKWHRAACVRFMLATKEGVVLSWEGIETVRQQPGVVDFIVEKSAGDVVLLPPHKFSDHRICYVITEGDDTTQAISRAEAALANVRCVIE